MLNELFSGVQMNHKNNVTHTTREGHMLEEDIKAIPIVNYEGNPTIIRMLPQGIYKIFIENEWYIFVIHDVLGPADYIKIYDQYTAFVVYNLRELPLYLRKFNTGCDLRTDGYYLQNAVNDKLDMLCIDGYTTFGHNEFITLDNPREINFTSIFNIRVTDPNGVKEDYIFSTKSLLKSMDVGHYGIYDTAYIESEIGRALFLFRLGKFTFSGYEPFVLQEDLCSNSYNVWFYTSGMVKLGSNIRCTHLQDYKYEDLIPSNIYKEGICAGIEESRQGLFIKLNKRDYPDWEAVKKKMLMWFTMTQEEAEEYNLSLYDVRNSTGIFNSITQYRQVFPVIATPFIVEYEYTNPEYRQLALDNYDIPIYFDHCNILINPYKAPSTIRAILGNLVAVVPKDGLIKSLEEMSYEQYEQIIANNFILDLLQSTNEYAGHEQLPLDDDLVGVSPLNWEETHRLKSIIELELESGNADKYADILRENKIIRNIFYIANKGHDPIYDISNSQFIALTPRNQNKKMKTKDELEQGTNILSELNRDNYIERNLILSAAYYVKASYFYKHLRIR